MFERGSLLFIYNFDFSSINPKYKRLEKLRNKYVVVLEKENHETLLCCFTTTLSNMPMLQNVKGLFPGCNKNILPYGLYCFDENVTTHCSDTVFTFPEVTFICGLPGQVYNFDLTKMYADYEVQDKIDHLGTLKIDTLFEILHCLNYSITLSDDLREKIEVLCDVVYTKIQAIQEQEREQ